jgi:hypothetical protein
MKWEFKPLKYNKTEGIHEPEENLTKWQKFILHFGQFIGKGLCGKWEFKFNIKF